MFEAFARLYVTLVAIGGLLLFMALVAALVAQYVHLVVTW